MNKNTIALAVLTSLASPVWAHVVDARNEAMGGVGVASAHYGTAALVNPALLAKYDGDDGLSIVLPSLGANIADQDDLVGDLDDIKDAYDAFQASGDSASADRLHDKLQQVDGKNATANAGLDLQVVVPNALASVGFVANGYAVGLLGTNISQNDLDYLQGIADGSIPADPAKVLESQAVALVALVQEYGVGVAHQFDLQGMPLYVGVTPKLQEVDTYNYSATITDYDRSDLNDAKYKSSSSGFNADVGVALDAGYMTYGLAVRDLVSRDIETKRVADTAFTYQVNPVSTLAAAYRSDWLTAAVDLDLNKTKGWKGFDDAQYAGIGAEFDAADWIQLRAGVRTDLTGTQPDLFTAGFGVSPWDVFHVDLAGQVGSDNAVGAALTMSLTL